MSFREVTEPIKQFLTDFAEANARDISEYYRKTNKTRGNSYNQAALKKELAERAKEMIANGEIEVDKSLGPGRRALAAAKAQWDPMVNNTAEIAQHVEDGNVSALDIAIVGAAAVGGLVAIPGILAGYGAFTIATQALNGIGRATEAKKKS